jgi:hypothetical protein
MRGMAVALQNTVDGNDNRIDILTAGPHKINNFTAEFVNRSEDLIKQNKMKIKFNRVSFKEVLSNFEAYDLDYVISFNTKNDRDKFFDPIISKAEQHNVEAAFYKY